MIWQITGLLLITALTMTVFHLQIVRVEEPFLRETFGAAYADYCRRVGRYFGRK